jgi:Rps23 Pro-64 3,4-dihydroxylase Tpa1-like proline 4-hydroxylase
MVPFAFSPALDAQTLHGIFARSGRLQITNFLSDGSARALLSYLSQSQDWKLTANRGDQIVDLAGPALAAMTREQHEKLAKAITLGGRYGFQFCYETIRLPKAGSPDRPSTPLAEFERFLSSPEAVAFFRTLTGVNDIDFADAHASRYRANHFLTAHDDEATNMGRRAAYVMNLSPEWRPDWGGLLLFHDDQGNILRGFTPAFNSLNIFKVPQRHSVSWVTPLAAHPRYAVTGWLRHFAASETAAGEG